MMKRIATISGITALALATLVGGWLFIATPGQADEDQSALASLISRLLTTPTTRVSIGNIDGALSSRAVISNITISDEEGPWLRLDRVALDWSRASLLRRRLQVNALDIGTVQYLRPAQTPPQEREAAESGPLFPELPLEVRIDAFNLEELIVGEPVLGEEARFSAEGSARLGDPSEGLDLTFAARRLDDDAAFDLELAYVPETNRLTLDLAFEEPAGGLVGNLLDLPGRPPVSLTLSGDDPLDNFDARLDFGAGPQIGARGQARVTRIDAAYDFDLDLTARLAGLMPPAAEPFFEGETRLTGAAQLRDDSSFRLDDLSLRTRIAALTVGGSISAERDLDVRVTGRALPGDDGVTRAGDISLEKLALDLQLRGPLTAPQLDGEIEAAGVDTPQASLETLDLTIAARPLGDEEVAERYDFSVDGALRGIALADSALDRALGGSLEIDAQGVVGTDGIADIAQARLMTPTFAGNFAGRVGADQLDATLSAMIADLAPFSGLAGMPLRGSADLTAQMAGSPVIEQVVVALTGDLRDFATGTDVIDGLLGETTQLRGRVAQIPGGLSFDALRLEGANLTAQVDGRADDSAADIRLDVTVPDMAPLDPRITAGRLDGDLRLTGSLERPDVTGDLRIADMVALERDIPRLALTLDGTDLTGLPDLRLELDGLVSGNVAQGGLRLRERSAGGYALEDLAITIGSARLAGAVSLDDENRAEGRIALDAGDLDDLSALLLTELRGSLTATIDLAIVDGGQNAGITARGAQLGFGDIGLSSFEADMQGIDLMRAPAFSGTARADRLTVAGQEFTRVALTAEGVAEETRFTAEARAQGFDLDARGRLTPRDSDFVIAMDALSATRGQRSLSLSRPARIVIADGTALIEDVAIAANGGRITIAGSAGEMLDLSVDVTSLPLSISEIFVPGLGLTGTANGAAQLRGTPDAPRGDYRITLSDVALPQLREAGIPSVNVTASGAIADQRVGVDATIEAAAASLRITGSAPLQPTDELDLRAQGNLDLAAANVILAPQGRRLTGAAQLDATIRGMSASPRIDGTATVSNGRFTDEDLGLDISGIAARLVAQGDVLRIESFSASTPNGGTLGASGQVRIDPAANFPGDLRITGSNARLVSNDLATATVDLDLSLTGPLATEPLVGGRVTLTTLDITVPDRLPATLQPLPGTRHVGAPEEVLARLALRDAEGRTRGVRFNARLDLTIDSPNRIFIRGRGIDAELGGLLRLSGTSLNPVAIGGFELRRGRFDLLGQRLDLTRGSLEFAGDLVPFLDFVAETQVSDATVSIVVTGPANDPEFILRSSPELPQDEILSRILFDQASGGLSAAQALQLAQGIATLTGGGPGAFDRLRRALGVDSLDITADAENPAVGVSRYIADNVRVGISAGARPEDTGVSVDIDLTRRLRLQSQIGADGSTSVGIGFEIEY
ncbi:MAG: translocation/assembly module TamB domain-containing protein [Salinarimonas sp.]|nr:translocation/assembly module TamB domain-containing protein [Salinarimonas sp.]